MRRSEMILDIASELVRAESDFIDFGKALALAEYVLDRIEKEGMIPPETEVRLEDGDFERENVWESEDG